MEDSCLLVHSVTHQKDTCITTVWQHETVNMVDPFTKEEQVVLYSKIVRPVLCTKEKKVDPLQKDKFFNNVIYKKLPSLLKLLSHLVQTWINRWTLYILKVREAHTAHSPDPSTYHHLDISVCQSDGKEVSTNLIPPLVETFVWWETRPYWTKCSGNFFHCHYQKGRREWRKAQGNPLSYCAVGKNIWKRWIFWLCSNSGF